MWLGACSPAVLLLKTWGIIFVGERRSPGPILVLPTPSPAPATSRWPHPRRSLQACTLPPGRCHCGCQLCAGRNGSSRPGSSRRVASGPAMSACGCRTTGGMMTAGMAVGSQQRMAGARQLPHAAARSCCRLASTPLHSRPRTPDQVTFIGNRWLDAQRTTCMPAPAPVLLPLCSCLDAPAFDLLPAAEAGLTSAMMMATACRQSTLPRSRWSIWMTRCPQPRQRRVP